MSVIEIHPEELFDKLVDGGLTADERERLQAHLATCETCRFELAVRGDFHAELSALEASPPLEAALLVAPKRAVRSNARRRALVWTVAAAALFIATGALASVVSGQSPWRLIASLAEGSGPAPSASVAVVKPRVARSTKPAVAPHTGAAPPTGEPAAPVLDAPPQVALPAAAEPAEPAGARPAVRPSLPSPTAAELFASANQARAAREPRRAVELYRTLQQRYPRSPEAALSRVTLATLLLHLGDARAALSAFDAYLSSGARPLEAEAQVGRALSLRALGLRDQEVSAWKLVAQRNPGTPYERRARERLSALGQP